jgi:hypothetical protein
MGRDVLLGAVLRLPAGRLGPIPTPARLCPMGRSSTAAKQPAGSASYNRTYTVKASHSGKSAGDSDGNSWSYRQ